METLVGSIIFLVVVCVLLITGFCIYRSIRRKIRGISQQFLGTPDLVKGLKQQEVMYDETPKSVSSTEPLAVPRINKDFPELDVKQLKSMNVAKIMKILNAIENNKPDSVMDEAEQIQGFVRSKVDDNMTTNMKINYENIKIHNCVVSRYIKDTEKASIIFQTSLEYIYSKGSQQDIANMAKWNKQKIQSRNTTEWIYWLSDINFDHSHTVHATCPSCGAPITNMGDKFCQYCGTAVVVDFKKTWEFNNIKEQ